MKIQRVGRTAAWVTIAILALITTTAITWILVQLGGFVNPDNVLTGLLRTDPLMCIAAAVAALAPWWALAAVLVQTQRRLSSNMTAQD